MKTTSRAFVLVLAHAFGGVVAAPASALTCLPPAVEQAFGTAEAAEEVYVPVLGTFTGFSARPEKESMDGLDRRFVASFEGHFITRSGLGRALSAEVAVTELCLGPWCPSFAPDVPVLTFLQQDGQGYRFQVDACHGNYFADPTEAQIETMQRCLRTRDCGG